jgi:hypothetical protein
MSESTKSAVLAKCDELWKSYPDDEIWGHCVWKNTGGWFDVRNETRTIRLGFNSKIPETDEIWQLAADILGIKQPEPLPPSDALLWECWKESANEKEWSARVRARESDRFNEWLVTIPPDTLKADRELVSSAFENEDWEKELINGAYTQEFIDAIKRLAGMEVENG